MIIDKISNLGLYFSEYLSDTIKNYLEKLSIDTLDGNYEIIKKDLLFCKVLTYETKNSDWITESHKDYTDIQIILSGKEKIEVYNLENLTIKTYYNKEIDCVFYNYPITNPIVSILLEPLSMAVFFAQDVHTTQIFANKTVESIKKVVFKVHKSLINGK